MVRVGIVNGIIFSLLDVHSEGFPVVAVVIRIVGLTVFFDKILDERIGTGGIIGQVGKADDVLIFSDGKAVNMPSLVQVLFGKLKAPAFLPFFSLTGFF